jgi:hypothetical protein
VRQCVFANNKGSRNDGPQAPSAVTVNSATVHIESSTFVNNIALSAPRGASLNQGVSLFCVASSTCTFNNSISWDGDTGDNTVQRVYYDQADSSLIVSFSDVLGGGGWAGAGGNIQADPLLDACFSPAAGSPVINAGDPAYAGPDAIDFLGNPRLQGGRLDMGAMEVQPSGGGCGGGGSGGGGSANRAPALSAGFTPAIGLGANQVSRRSWHSGIVQA